MQQNHAAEYSSFCSEMLSGEGHEALETCDLLYRQMLIIFHSIHYRLDRPFLPDDRWQEQMDMLKKELQEGLDKDRIPSDWMGDYMAGSPGSDKYEACRKAPLFAPAREKVRNALKEMERIDSTARRFSRRSERRRYRKNELDKIRRRELKNAWDATWMIGFENI